MDEPRRSIQDLIPPARSKPLRPPVPPQAPPQSSTATRSEPPRRAGFRLRTWAIAVGALVVIGVACIIASLLFHRATATITIRSFTLPVSGTFEASPTGANLAFVTTSIDETLSRTVPSTGTTYAEDSAKGTLTIKNAYSSTPQKLIANTRFESPDGRIYRIRAPVNVPGYTGSGSTLKPGTIDVTVFADAPGEKYNMTGPTDFSLPGLKGSPQFSTITAQLAGSLAGGFAGDKPIVSDAVRAQAVQDLSQLISEKVRASFVESLGTDDLVFPDSIVVSVVSLPDISHESGSEIAVTATASAPVFSKAALAMVIAHEGGVSYAGPLIITNVEDLSTSVSPSKTAENLSLTITGTAILKGVYDQTSLRASLAGKNRRDVADILPSYPAVADMKISVYPFWKGILPKNPDRITIVESLE